MVAVHLRRTGALTVLPAALGALALAVLLPAVAPAQVVEFVVEGDGIPKSLTGKPGSVQNGRALVAAGGAANCRECHSLRDRLLPDAGKSPAKAGGNAPALDGVGARLTPPQLRLSVVDYTRLMPKVEMPSFHKAGTRAAAAKEDPARPLLSAQEVEDVVAYLASLRM